LKQVSGLEVPERSQLEIALKEVEEMVMSKLNFILFPEFCIGRRSMDKDLKK